PFVFAVFVVDKDDHAPRLQFRDGVLDTAEIGRHRRLLWGKLACPAGGKLPACPTAKRLQSHFNPKTLPRLDTARLMARLTMGGLLVRMIGTACANSRIPP